MEHGLDPLGSSDANEDADGDGRTNLEEYEAGTDPKDSQPAAYVTSAADDSEDDLLSGCFIASVLEC
jgi:hypothetical protein